MANIFPIDFEEKLTMAQDDYILFSDSEDGNKIKKAQYKNLKGEKWDTWATWPQWPQWETWPQWPQGIQGIQWETWPQWETGEQWPQGEQWEQGIQWPQWIQWEQWPKWETWATGATWPQWPTWATGNWISTITETTSWKVHTITITETDWDTTVFTVSDGADGEWAWDVIWPNWAVDSHVALFDSNTWKLIKDWWALPSVINNLTSTSTTDALSAAQWKALKDAIDNISWLWKFLSLWNSATWQPISFPLATPYTYTTWDWFMVETVWTTNYKPTWSSYTWTASTTVETESVEQWDVYIYDWTTWLLQKNTAVEVSFSAIAWQPTDNSALATALGNKQDTLVSWTNIKTVNSTSLLGSWDVAVQPTLVSWTNIKTVNSTSLLWSGDVAVQPTLVSGTNIKTVNSTSLLGSGDIAVQAVLNQLTSAQIKTGTATTDSSVTASALAWAVPVLSTQANNLLTSWMKIWVGTQANYEALDSYDNSTAYLTI